MTTRKHPYQRDNNWRPRSWRDGPHGGLAEDSPDDYDEEHLDEDPQDASDVWRASDDGPEGSPDDYDEEPPAPPKGKKGDKE